MALLSFSRIMIEENNLKQFLNFYFTIVIKCMVENISESWSTFGKISGM